MTGLRADGGRSAGPGGPRGTRPRHRDRHGRGLRGDLLPPHLPGHRSRREEFDDTVLDAARALVERYPRRLEHLQVAVEEVPTSDPAPWEESAVALGRAFPADRDHPPRVVLFRRPIQTRCARPPELELLVRQVLADQIASLLHLAPEDVDPEAWDEE
jgi:predicted Zn-dependent protease with MMP-like domain